MKSPRRRNWRETMAVQYRVCPPRAWVLTVAVSLPSSTWLGRTGLFRIRKLLRPARPGALRGSHCPSNGGLHGLGRKLARLLLKWIVPVPAPHRLPHVDPARVLRWGRLFVAPFPPPPTARPNA